MGKKLNKNTKLSAELIDDKIIITIGYSTLSYAVSHRYDLEYREYRVLDSLEFSKDILGEILKEDETGASLLTDLFDKAAQNIVDNGDTTAIEYKKKKL